MKRSFKIAAMCIYFFSCALSVTAQEYKEIKKSFTIDKSGEVVIDTYKGKVKIEPSGSNAVEVYIKIEPDHNFMGTNSKQQLENADVKIEASSHSVKLKSVYKHDDGTWFGGNTRAFINYIIKMPKTAVLDVKDYKSDSDITGLESAVEFETYKGSVRIRNLTGSMRFETYKGEAEIEFAKFAGDSRFETYKGDISISLPKNAAFTIDANFGHRVDFDNEFNISNESTGRKKKDYKITEKVNGGGPELNLSSDKGNFKLLAK